MQLVYVQLEQRMADGLDLSMLGSKLELLLFMIVEMIIE